MNVSHRSRHSNALCPRYGCQAFSVRTNTHPTPIFGRSLCPRRRNCRAAGCRRHTPPSLSVPTASTIPSLISHKLKYGLSESDYNNKVQFIFSQKSVIAPAGADIGNESSKAYFARAASSSFFFISLLFLSLFPLLSSEYRNCFSWSGKWQWQRNARSSNMAMLFYDI